MAETNLELERRHLRRAEQLIACQEQRVRRLMTIGNSHTLALAHQVLAGLRQSSQLSRDRIAYLERSSPSEEAGEGLTSSARKGT